jgi:hypothetical protein
MGAGVALEAKKKFKGIDEVFGAYIHTIINVGRLFQQHITGMSSTGCCLYGCVPKLYHSLGMFQTKYHWKDKSPLDLIEFSTNMLHHYAESRPDETFHLPYPGINNGGLRPGQVYPIIKNLPDNVFVWRLTK